MTWHFNTGDNTCHKEYQVEVWRWWPRGIIAFETWAKEHNIRYEYRQDEIFEEATEIVFYKHWHDTLGANPKVRALDSSSFLVYKPFIDALDCFPFEAISSEDLHKNYLWSEGFDEEWEWNEDNLKHFRLWAEEHDIQFRRTIWDKEGHGDLLSFPVYRNEYGIAQGVIIWPGDILHYSYDKRANAKFPFSVIKGENND